MALSKYNFYHSDIKPSNILLVEYSETCEDSTELDSKEIEDNYIKLETMPSDTNVS